MGNSDVENEEETPPRRTVIVGFGRVGRIVAELLREHDRPYIAVDADIDTVAAARRDGFIARSFDVGRPGSPSKLGIANGDAVTLAGDHAVAQKTGKASWRGRVG